jgi:hypothetical protein
MGGIARVVEHKETLRGAAVAEGDLVCSEAFPARTDLRLSRTIAHAWRAVPVVEHKGLLNTEGGFRREAASLERFRVEHFGAPV